MEYRLVVATWQNVTTSFCMDEVVLPMDKMLFCLSCSTVVYWPPVKDIALLLQEENNLNSMA